MLQMQNVIISDSSCLILLEKIGELDLLRRLYGEILITPEVVEEVSLPTMEWIKIRAAGDLYLQHIIFDRFGLGEASSIALATELESPLLIIDDNKAKQYAKRLGIHVTGTFGVLIAAKEVGILPQIGPVLEKIAQTNFRFDDKVRQMVLKAANEKS